MTSLIQTAREKAKAILAGVFLLAVGVTEWAVQDPTIGAWVQHLIPAPYSLLVPGILGAVGLFCVHHFPNAQPTSVAFEEPTTDTTLVKLSAINGGEFTGTPAH